MRGLARGPCLSRVHMSVMHCSVLPKPISSAMIHPHAFSIRTPVTHSYMNCTPSRWWGLSMLDSTGSTTTWISILSLEKNKGKTSILSLEKNKRKTFILSLEKKLQQDRELKKEFCFLFVFFFFFFCKKVNQAGWLKITKTSDGLWTSRT